MRSNSIIRRHKTHPERLRIVAEYEPGQKTQEEVATQHGIGLSTLRRWLRRQRGDKRPAGPPLLELPNLLGRPSAGRYRLHFPRELMLEVEPGFDPEEVRLLARLLHRL
jgi:transposase-like protein